MIKRKKTTLLLIIFVLLLIIGGVFLWLRYRETEPDLSYENEYVKAEEFKIIENSEGRFVVCEEQEFRVKVPEGWRVEKDDNFNVVYLLDPLAGDNFIENAKEKGACGMSIEIYVSERVNSEITTFADDIKEEIKYLRKNPGYGLEDKESREEVVVLNDRYGIRRTRVVEEIIRFINVRIPINQTVYTFSSGFIGTERCVEEFNKNLETIMINR